MSLPPRVFDRDLIAQHLKRRAPGAEDFVTQIALDDLAARLITITRDFDQALIMGPDGARLPLMGRSASGAFAFERVSTVLGSEEAPLVDPEMLLLPRQGYDLIVSLFDLQVVNDVPGFLSRIRAHLRPDGLMIAAALGGDSLTELRQAFLRADSEITGGAFARVAPFIPLADIGGLLQRAGFALPVADLETYPVRYSDALKLMRELKGLGAQNPLADRPGRAATRTLIGAAAAAYEELAGDPDGRVRATLEIVWLLGWAPHESQQKPLRRGSATVSLKDVLGKDG
ncbi:SAM-dependent methyltransferase [Devosia sp. ZB163]|uniref:methyltransferase domain-containing protein n=1 Tax=Devosia sp. ZB163 TaxID=3025938 RepID=UPI002362D7C1|nr:methyltransferase domain-containing protein [Devosia sp. ZB163]MDC9826545.1 SAM-dependent methyltransferase [Devosia sp. ZB163]